MYGLTNLLCLFFLACLFAPWGRKRRYLFKQSLEIEAILSSFLKKTRFYFSRRHPCLSSPLWPSPWKAAPATRQPRVGLAWKQRLHLWGLGSWSALYLRAVGRASGSQLPFFLLLLISSRRPLCFFLSTCVKAVSFCSLLLNVFFFFFWRDVRVGSSKAKRLRVDSGVRDTKVAMSVLLLSTWVILPLLSCFPHL